MPVSHWTLSNRNWKRIFSGNVERHPTSRVACVWFWRRDTSIKTYLPVARWLFHSTHQLPCTRWLEYSVACWQVCPDFSAMREMKMLRVHCINSCRGCEAQPVFGKLKVCTFQQRTSLFGLLTRLEQMTPCSIYRSCGLMLSLRPVIRRSSAELSSASITLWVDDLSLV